LNAGSPFWWRVFGPPLRWWMERRVRTHVTGVTTLPTARRPVLLCANHESFWDGFLLREVQRRVRPGASYRAVMLESELTGRPWLGLLGAMGVAPGSPTSTRSLLRGLEALSEAQSGSVVAFFPQGRIRPDDPRPLGFRRGITLVADALAPATLVPVGLRVLPGKTARVEAYLSLGDPIDIVRGSRIPIGRVEAAVEEELNALRSFVAEHGEDAPARWPSEWASLPRTPRAERSARLAEPWISRN
jgi:chlorobactene lauroyltransferase